MNTKCKPVDLTEWERRDTFFGFKDFEFPFSVVGTEIDITKARRHWRRAKLSPYLSLVYAICSSANAVPAFRQRIRGNEVVEFERVHADFTIPKGEASFTIKHVEFRPEFSLFYQDASREDSGSWGHPGDGDETNDHWVYMSSMPWIRFTHIVQPTNRQSGSIPRIAWGKFSPEGENTMLPISIQTNHALVDGIHVAKFLECLETLLAAPENTFS